MLIPLEYRYKENRQHRICHENMVTPIFATDITGYQLIEIKVLPAIRDSHDKKHILYR
jgi:hypothetical protein